MTRKRGAHPKPVTRQRVHPIERLTSAQPPQERARPPRPFTPDLKPSQVQQAALIQQNTTLAQEVQDLRDRLAATLNDLRQSVAHTGPRTTRPEQSKRRATAGPPRAAEDELLRAIVDQAADGITVRDTTGRLLFANAAAQRLAGQPTAGTTLEEAPGIWGATFDPAGTPLSVETWPISRALRGETVRGVEWQRVLPDGTRRVVLNSAAPLKDSTGTIFGAVSITTDISERKRGEEALARYTGQLESVRAITEEITRELDLSRVLDLIIQRAVGLLGGVSGDIYLWEDRQKHLVPAAWIGAGEWMRDIRVPLGEWIAGRVAQQRQGLIVNDYQTSPLANPAYRVHTEIAATMAEPLLYGERLVGVITVDRAATGHPFTPADSHLLRLFASQAAIAIENARLYAVAQQELAERRWAEDALRQAKDELEQRVQERTAELAQFVQALTEEVAQRKAAEVQLHAQAAQLRTLATELTLAEERERQRLSQLLHDGLQQLLVAARWRVQRLQDTAPPRVPDACSAVLALLEDAITTTRSLSAELSPTVLQSAGFGPALAWLARWMEETHHLTVDLKADPQVEPGSDAAKVLLFQSVRELLFNAVKHAGVPHATVEVTRQHAHLQIVVADHGNGFDPERLQAAGVSGLGLASIRQRLEYLGGSMDIASAPGQGSRFTLSIPLSQG